MRPTPCTVSATKLATFLLLFPLALAAQAPAASTPAKPAPKVCTVDRTPPTEGEADIARTDYTKAETFYRAAIAKDAASAEANLGLVRSLVGEDKTAEAISAATAFLAAHTGNPLAELALAEADFRAANFVDTRSHLIAALNADGCEGRVLDDLADLLEIFAYHATEARYLAKAHALRPNDELIRRDWISTLPRKQREVELARYLESAPALSEKDRNGFANEEDHLKARRPGECRVTSRPQANSDTVKVPFALVFGDSSMPQAYGLDVTFDGKRRRMQIDTGASGITLSPGAARGLGLKPEFQTRTGGVGDEGEVGSYLTHVASIQIGDVQLSDCMVEVLQKSKLDVDGLIGMDVFSKWLVTLDYPNARLMLNPLPPRPDDKPAAPAAVNSETAAEVDDETLHDAIVPPTEKTWLPVVRLGHELLLPAIINGGPVHYMMVDTGASLTSLSLAYAKEAGKAHIDDGIEFTGISGKVKKAYRLDNAKLQFGNVRLPPVSFYAFDITPVSHDTGVEVSGFVGLETLSRLTITIDYRDNLMELKYDPNKDMRHF
jgi:predicted aspartyl protease/tetratricopeptide (TPR) repeat protein